MSTTVGEVMTRAPFTIGGEQSLAAAAHRMADLHVRHLPVLHGGRLVGVVSERDVALVESLAGVDPQRVPVSEAMTDEPYSCASTDPLAVVARTMAERRLGTALVVDEGKLVGLFTTTDALHVLAELLAVPR
jgi:acetoin utilization protein AcuB